MPAHPRKRPLTRNPLPLLEYLADLLAILFPFRHVSYNLRMDTWSLIGACLLVLACTGLGARLDRWLASRSPRR